MASESSRWSFCSECDKFLCMTGQPFMIAMIAFASVFFLVGAWRVVEFSGHGFSKTWRYTLCAIHLAGCALFSAAMIAYALDAEQKQKMLVASFLAPSMLLLMPTHIYIGLKRRVRLNRASSKE